LNKKRLSVNFIIIATLAVIFGTAMTNSNGAWAARIHCPTAPGTNVCNGTFEDDKMLGTAEDDDMFGYLGDDTMFGFSGNDKMIGAPDDDTMSGGSGNDVMDGDFTQVPGAGNDNINGDSGHDTIQGFGGADTLKGSSGNDRIAASFIGSTFSDIGKDEIDCGSGNDEAWININPDGDTAASNCETVHSDVNP
jgi:Ca2+-binding RTX toxin-like protein